MSADLLSFFKNHVYVGMMTQTQALVQFRTGLYAIDMANLSRELGYELMLRTCHARAGDAGAAEAPRPNDAATIGLKDRLPVCETLRTALRLLREDGEYEGDDESIESLVRTIQGVVKQHRNWMEMILGLVFEVGDGDSNNDGGDGDGEVYLRKLPACFGAQYLPDHGRLPDFFLAMARDIEWERDGDEALAESVRVDTACRAIAELFTFTVDDEVLNAKDGDQGQPKPTSGDWMMQHILSPLLKSSFCPSEKLNTDGSILLVTKLETLYRVFERC